ncbi:MAG: TonB-dependent receptor [Holophagaceae bacterium]|nr:TonB-dependent receptor [Holophagaceae bacterium]
MIHLSNLGRIATLLAVGSGALIAQGVQTGNLEGRVTGRNGAPVVGAAVRFETGQGVRTTATDAQGRFRMPLLIVGPGTLTVNAQGYISQRSNTRVALGQTNVVNFALREVGVASETVEISGSVTAIDPTTVTSGKNTTAASFDTLPITGRGVASLASITPGVVNSTIRGGQSNHTQWLIDGADMLDPVTGGGILYLNEEVIQEVQVVTGGATADMGRFTGGMVNVVTKSGTNEFMGTARYEITNPNWQAMAPLAAPADSQHSTLQIYHLSGPIWKDHIFFSAGYRTVTPIAKTVEYSTAPKELGGQQPYLRYRTDERIDLKIDWHLNQYHRLFGQYNDTKMDRFGVDYTYFWGGGGTSPETMSAQPDKYGNISLGYVGTLTDSLVLKANYSQKYETLGGPGGGGQGGPDVITMVDWTTGNFYDNGMFGFDEDDRPVKNATLSTNWFVDSPFGSHDLKVGVDWFQSSRSAANAQTPTDMLVEFGGFIVDPYEDPSAGWGLDNRDFEDAELWWWPTFQGATNKNTIISYYINDKIKFNDKFSANIGLRYDSFKSENDIKANNYDISAFSPRITGIYDLHGDGRWVFEAGYNIYAGQVMQGATDGASLVGNPAEYAYLYVGGPGNLRSSYSDTPFFVYNPELYRHANLIDPNMKPPTMDEISASVRFSDGKAGFYSLSYSQRKWKNFVATWKNEQPNPIDDFDMVVNHITNDDALKRDYKGLEFQFEKQLTREFSFGGNITISETKGNFEGGQTGSDGPLRVWGPLGTTDPVFNADGALVGAYQPTEQQIAPYGYLGNDRPLMMRTWANYRKEVFGNGNLNLGVYAHYTSGAPYANTASARMSGYRGGIFGSSYTRYFTERGALRFNSYYNVSLQVGYDHAIWKGAKLFGQANITNLFNHQMLVNWNTTGSAVWNNGGSYQTDNYNRPNATFLPGGSYGKPTSVNNYLSARDVQLVLGLRF